MKILNFGSLNVDYIYEVDSFPAPGETVRSLGQGIYGGGKGLNRSVALAKAGMPVFHAGSIGSDGNILLETLRQSGINTDYIYRQEGPSGHTIIEVDSEGQNTILFYGGANTLIPRAHIDAVFKNFTEGDMLVTENEINETGYIIESAQSRGMTVLFNPSPFDPSVLSLPLDKVDCFVINQAEGEKLAETRRWENIIPKLSKKYPGAHILLTLGENGAKYCDGSVIYHQNVFPVKRVDATAAGDAFLGYFIYGLMSGKLPQEALRIASKAAAVTVTRKGSAVSIPTINEVMGAD